jgi:hypothetical protein
MIRFKLRAFWSAFFLLILATCTSGKDRAPQVLVWPTSGQPVVRFSLGKFKEIGSSGKQHNYSIDVTAENL